MPNQDRSETLTGIKSLVKRTMVRLVSRFATATPTVAHEPTFRVNPMAANCVGDLDAVATDLSENETRSTIPIFPGHAIEPLRLAATGTES